MVCDLVGSLNIIQLLLTIVILLQPFYRLINRT